MSLINLRHFHTNVRTFKHPLLDHCKPYRDSELDLLCAVVIGCPDEGERLVLALRSCLRHMIRRYLANFPQTEAYLDDMVSEGFLAICDLVENLSVDLLNGRTILYVASQRIQSSIELMLNKVQSLSAPSRMTQFRRVKEDKDPIYLSQTSLDDVDVDVDDQRMMFNIRDVYEGLEKIEARDWLDAMLLCPENWGRTEADLADEFGIGKTTIHRRKKELYDEFLKLTR